MEPFLYGCLTTIAIVAIIKRAKGRFRMKRIGFRQSILHGIVKETIPSNSELYRLKQTQSRIHSKRNVVRVIQTPDNKAYWVEKNIFYCADVRDGEFDPTTGKPVDTDNMSQRELKDLMLILDTLKSQNG